MKNYIDNIAFEDNILKIEILEITNNNLDKTYIDMLKGIIDEEQYKRINENIK